MDHLRLMIVDDDAAIRYGLRRLVEAMGGFTTARKLRELKPELKIILVSQYSDHVYAEEALQLGVNGYVLKRNAGRDLEEAFEAVQSGQTFVSPYITERKTRVKAAL